MKKSRASDFRANRPRPVIRVTAMPADAQAYGDILGEWLMSLMDIGAALVAARHSHGRAVRVAMGALLAGQGQRGCSELSYTCRFVP